MFILVNDLSNRKQPNYIWYVYDVNLLQKTKRKWRLSSTQTLKKEDAKLFGKVEAEGIAEILNGQVDEEGYSSKWVVEQNISCY